MKKTMSTNIIDISVSLDNDMPVWPNGHGVAISKLFNQKNGDEATVSRLDMDVHNGTHIDAPLHFISDGKTTKSISLDRLIGKCQVLSFEGKEKIDYKSLIQSNYREEIPNILLKTDNSKLWANPKHAFYTDYTALTLDGAEWMAEQKINLVGIDYHSIQLYKDPFDTHKILLSNEIIILEGINLSKVEEGIYELYCLPLKINNAEGAPARAILKKL